MRVMLVQKLPSNEEEYDCVFEKHCHGCCPWCRVALHMCAAKNNKNECVPVITLQFWRTSWPYFRMGHLRTEGSPQHKAEHCNFSAHEDCTVLIPETGNYFTPTESNFQIHERSASIFAILLQQSIRVFSFISLSTSNSHLQTLRQLFNRPIRAPLSLRTPLPCHQISRNQPMPRIRHTHHFSSPPSNSGTSSNYHDHPIPSPENPHGCHPTPH